MFAQSWKVLQRLADTNVGMPSGLDPKLAARLNELGPIAIARPESKIPQKVLLLALTLLIEDGRYDDDIEKSGQYSANFRRRSAR